MPRSKFQKTLDKPRCFNCGQDGHTAINCPTPDKKFEDKECLHCRQKGHSYKNCPHTAEFGGTVRCYTCGKTGHASRQCTMMKNTKSEDKFKYAECFICKQVGHLSSQCPENTTKTIYPRGGSCHSCGATDHLSRYCPKKTPEERAAERLDAQAARRQERLEAKKAKFKGKKDDQPPEATKRTRRTEALEDDVELDGDSVEVPVAKKSKRVVVANNDDEASLPFASLAAELQQRQTSDKTA